MARTDSTFRTRIAQVIRGVRRVIGAPDYDAYLAHCRHGDPCELPLSREAFIRERLSARYSRPGSRCC